jgi:hypothetical protein
MAAISPSMESYISTEKHLSVDDVTIGRLGIDVGSSVPIAGDRVGEPAEFEFESATSTTISEFESATSTTISCVKSSHQTAI